MDVHIDRSQIADIARETQAQNLEAALQKFISSPMFIKALETFERNKTDQVPRQRLQRAQAEQGKGVRSEGDKGVRGHAEDGRDGIDSEEHL